MGEGDLARDLLAWYDRHARRLPWRVPPGGGGRPDPYRVWLSEVMLQQTTVAAVAPYFERFVARWPTVEALAAAEDADVMAAWAGLGYYARARNLLAGARAVAARGGFPGTEAELLKMPGIGPYTAAAVAAIAFGEPAAVVDGNVERVMARVFDVAAPLPRAKTAIRAHAAALTPAHRPGDYAQAVMDLGATVCTPKRPACVICPWSAPCLARARGVQGERPVKPPKRAAPVRRGTAWVGRRADGAWLVETRAPSRMLGGMLGWPDSGWDARAGAGAGAGAEGGAGSDPGPPAQGDWRAAGEVRHGFSHFELRLDVLAGRLGPDAAPSRGAFVPDLDPAALPTVMRRAFAVAAVALEAAEG